MEKWLLSPPLVFPIVFLLCWGLSNLFSRIALKVNKPAKGAQKSYACGEDDYKIIAQPDYSQFFSFAFFFTIAHVATLIITTAPIATLGVLAMAGLYLAGIVTGLFILLRK